MIDGIRAVFLVAAPLALLALVVVLGLREVLLQGAREPRAAARPAEPARTEQQVPTAAVR